MRNYFGVIPIVGVCLLMIGCGSNQKLSGKATFSDGEPLTSGTVVFSKEGFVSRSPILKDGSFNAASVGKNDGIPPGTYKVYIMGAVVLAEPDNPRSDEIKQLIDVKYASPETTPLEITIPGSKTYDIIVERPALPTTK